MSISLHIALLSGQILSSSQYIGPLKLDTLNSKEERS